jgi:putative transposase
MAVTASNARLQFVLIEIELGITFVQRALTAYQSGFDEHGDSAKLALTQLHRELMDLNPSAARSLAEGLEESLTVHRLRIPPQLRKSLACTNIIESAFSIVERVCRNVKRWHDGDQRERWVGSGLLVAERQFRRVQGYKQIPNLLRELEAIASPKSAVVKRKKAS